MIHICYGIYDKTGHYSKFIGISMISIFENTKESVTVHILHDVKRLKVTINALNFITSKPALPIKLHK